MIPVAGLQDLVIALLKKLEGAETSITVEELMEARVSYSRFFMRPNDDASAFIVKLLPERNPEALVREGKIEGEGEPLIIRRG